MAYLGDIRLGDTIYFDFTTRRFSTGAPFTLAGTPSLACYENSVTQITAGITLTVDYDSVTGKNHVVIVASSGNGYAAAKNYSVSIAAGTVDSVSVVGETVAHFSIENRSALMPTTAARTLDVSAGGEAGVDWANVGSPTTAVNLSGTNIDPDQVVASVTGAVGSVTGAVGSVTGAVGSVTGAVGSVTGNVGGNVSGSVASVTAGVTLADDAITAAKFDESTAFPLASADTAATQVARTGADGDTLETLSDQLDIIDGNVDDIEALAILIDAVTAQFVFTVANQVDANIQSINDVTVLGDGSGTPWGP